MDMLQVLSVLFLVVVAIAWVISAIGESIERSKRHAKAKSRMLELGLAEKDLAPLLARVPNGYLERSLYHAKKHGEKALASSTDASVVEAVVDLHFALIKHEKQAERVRQENEEKQRKLAQLMDLASSSGPPSRHELVIVDEDYIRDNETDRTFRRLFLLRLLTLYENACAICGNRENGLDLDHFFIPKSKGGNFLLIRHDGLKINNAVPMCESCNRAKGNKDWQKVADHPQLSQILGRNAEANKLVNSPPGTNTRARTRRKRRSV